MNIRLGIYEVFSRIVPGAIYLTAIIQLLAILGLLTINWSLLDNFSLAHAAVFTTLAYILGVVFDRLAIIWYLLFKPTGISTRVLQNFKAKHKDKWTIDIEDKHWPILLAHIRTRNLDIASDIDRYNAFSIMLRNISLGLLMIMLNFLIQFAIGKSTSYLLIAVVVLIASIFVVREGVRHREWFYNNIFETTIAYQLDLAQHIKPVKFPPKSDVVGKE